jgi:hypothetical protein
VCDNAEVARWKRIVTGSFEAKVETDSQRHRSGSGEVLLQAGEKVSERALTAGEERMRMACLRCPGSLGRGERESVALQYHHMFEVIGENTCRWQPGHPGADHDGLPAD